MPLPTLKALRASQSWQDEVSKDLTGGIPSPHAGAWTVFPASSFTNHCPPRPTGGFSQTPLLPRLKEYMPMLGTLSPTPVPQNLSRELDSSLRTRILSSLFRETSPVPQQSHSLWAPQPWQAPHCIICLPRFLSLPLGRELSSGSFTPMRPGK